MDTDNPNPTYKPVNPQDDGIQAAAETQHHRNTIADEVKHGAEALGDKAAEATNHAAEAAEAKGRQWQAKSREAANQANRKARELRAEADQKRADVAEKSRQRAQELKAKALEKKDQAKQKVRDRAEAGKVQAAREINDLKSAASVAATELRERDSKIAARVVETVSHRLEGVVDYLESHDVDELMGKALQLARKNGTVVIGSAFVGGLALSRFLRASAQRKARHEHEAAGFAENSFQGTPRAYGGTASSDLYNSDTDPLRALPKPGTTTTDTETIVDTSMSQPADLPRPQDADPIPSPVAADAAPVVRESADGSAVAVDTDPSGDSKGGAA